VLKQHIAWGDGYAVIGVTTADAWSALSKEERRVTRQPNRDCFESAVGLSCKSLRSSLSAANPLAIQVDEAGDIAGLASAYKTLKLDPLYRDSLGALCFADDRKLRSIQAADLLAHMALRQWRKSKLTTLDPRFERLMGENLANVQNHILLHDANSLSAIAKLRLRRGQ
jgi:hypothetical protein